MSTTPTTVGLPVRRWSIKRYAVLIALVLALAAGTFGIYSLAGTQEATPTLAPVIDARPPGDGCSASFAVGGGLVEGQSVSNACGGRGGSGVHGGVQP